MLILDKKIKINKNIHLTKKQKDYEKQKQFFNLSGTRGSKIMSDGVRGLEN